MIAVFHKHMGLSCLKRWIYDFNCVKKDKKDRLHCLASGEWQYIYIILGFEDSILRLNNRYNFIILIELNRLQHDYV